ncbi:MULTISPECIES: HepT-like ribonuclease domain-containing protein [Pseudomonadota]|jgi:uncharacterized protein with HEPN domain|uniref:HepT-like ribonuclease domain-containing protein n=1 Tax=Pseudomonadota TaxID=1224 RepID=UPI00076AC18E|nr:MULTISPECIES: HepT-like ribonuclease domain-containing protein [Pseudomonadota]MAF62606.1 DUF86 domain-containing protein [Blastomonas sp.]|tara:strand:+ start:67965 stop:68309 length:345 start_codon:yes stop_codon:yes gene_type:complete
MAADRDALYLSIIAEALDDIRRRMEDCDFGSFLADRDEQALTAFRLSIIGENANKLSNELKSRHPHLPWLDMIGFRNIVAHEYHRVDPAMAWQAVQSLDEIEAMVSEEMARPDE